MSLPGPPGKRINGISIPQLFFEIYCFVKILEDGILGLSAKFMNASCELFIVISFDSVRIKCTLF